MKVIIKLLRIATILCSIICILQFNPANVNKLIAIGILDHASAALFRFTFFLSVGYLGLLIYRNKRAIAGYIKACYKNYAALLLAVIISLGGAETAVRIINKINKTRAHYIRSYEVSYWYQKNSQGFRDEEFKLAKAKDTFRIFLIGDSFVEGNVDPEHTFDKILENKCKKDGFNCEAFSLGIGGTGPSSYWWVANQFKDYKPDLVIVSVYVDNDVEVTSHFKTKPSAPFLHALEKIKIKIQVKENSELLKLIDEFFAKRALYAGIKELPIEQRYKELMYTGRISPWSLQRALTGDMQNFYDSVVDLFHRDPAFRYHISAIQELYKDTPFLLLINPSKYQVNVDYFDDMRKIGYHFNENKLIDRKIQDAIIAWCTDNQIRYFDILPDMLASPLNSSFYYKFDDHYTALGNEFTMDKMYEYIKQSGCCFKTR